VQNNIKERQLPHFQMSFEDRMDEKEFKKRKIEQLSEPITMELLFGEVIGLRRDIFEINKRQKTNEDTIDRVENMLDQEIGAMIVDLQKDVKSISESVEHIEDDFTTSGDIHDITKKINEFEEKTMKKISEIEDKCNDIDRNIDNINYIK
jgi:predicted  nucleic acid-binding Zn-ribbon protein